MVRNKNTKEIIEDFIVDNPGWVFIYAIILFIISVISMIIGLKEIAVAVAIIYALFNLMLFYFNFFDRW